MAKTHGPNFIDGFASVQAVKRSKTGGQGVRARPSSDKLPSLDKPKSGNISSKSHAKNISRSVMPEKFNITCYECEYIFTLHGRVSDNFCPKCHEKLLAKDITIDKEWSKDIKTIGRVEIKKGAVLKKCSITARDLMLGADASEATLNIYNKLELSRGASFNVPETEIRTLVVLNKSSITLKGKTSCAKLEVLGTIRANIVATEGVIVEKTGFLKGTVKAPRLVVRDGAALKAKLKIGTEG